MADIISALVNQTISNDPQLSSFRTKLSQNRHEIRTRLIEALGEGDRSFVKASGDIIQDALADLTDDGQRTLSNEHEITLLRLSFLNDSAKECTRDVDEWRRMQCITWFEVVRFEAFRLTKSLGLDLPIQTNQEAFEKAIHETEQRLTCNATDDFTLSPLIDYADGLIQNDAETSTLQSETRTYRTVAQNPGYRTPDVALIIRLLVTIRAVEQLNALTDSTARTDIKKTLFRTLDRECELVQTINIPYILAKVIVQEIDPLIRILRGERRHEIRREMLQRFTATKDFELFLLTTSLNIGRIVLLESDGALHSLLPASYQPKADPEKMTATSLFVILYILEHAVRECTDDLDDWHRMLRTVRTKCISHPRFRAELIERCGNADATWLQKISETIERYATYSDLILRTNITHKLLLLLNGELEANPEREIEPIEYYSIKLGSTVLAWLDQQNKPDIATRVRSLFCLA